jgi:hypothetical protein
MATGQTVVRLVLIIAAAIVLFLMVAYYNRNKERFSVPQQQQFAPQMQQMPQQQMPQQAIEPIGASFAYPSASYGPVGGASTGGPTGSGAPFLPAGPAPAEPLGNEMYRPVGGSGSGPYVPNDPFPQDRITPDQLLPKDAANSKWAQANPAGQGDVKDQNFLTASYHIGINTQGNSLRNASHDIRSTIPNPRYRVSIWNQSNIEPDMNRRPLE